MQHEFNSFIDLQGAQLSSKFYDAVVPRDTLPPELQAVDREIESLAAKKEQQWVKVYRDSGVRDALRMCFQKRTLELFRALLERRRQICEQLNDVSDPFSKRFPPEITSAIFEWAIAPSQTNHITSNTPDLRDTLRLASVMRSWRSIILATPSLWNSLRLCYSDERNDMQTFEEFMEIFDIFIQRSGAIGIHLHAKMGHGCEDYSEQIVAVLRRESPRIRTLQICLPQYTHRYADYLDLLDFPFPTADVVVVHAPFQNEDNHALTLQLPRVTELCFGAPNLGELSSYVSTLTHLELGTISLRALRLLLESASTLQALKARRGVWSMSDMLEIDEDGETVIIRSNEGVTVVQPLIHNCLQHLDYNDAEVLCLFSFPNIRTLFLWGDHLGLDRFIARAGCRPVHLGANTLSAIKSLATMDSVRRVRMELGHSFSYPSLVDDLNDCDEPTASLVKSALARVESITVHVVHCSTCTARNSQICCLQIKPFVEFLRKYGSRLKHFEIRAECFIRVTDDIRDMCDTSPPIRVNGRALAEYHHPEFRFDPRRDVGCDLLDWIDCFILWALKAKAFVSSIPGTLYRKLGLRKQADVANWERGGWGTNAWDDSGTWGGGDSSYTWDGDAGSLR